MLKLLMSAWTLGFLIWGGIALHIAHEQQQAEAQMLPLMAATPVDMPFCITIRNQPLLGTHPTAKDPHPRMPDNA